MAQIILNYLIVFIIPFFIGLLARICCYKWSKGWIITSAAAVLTMTALIVVLVIPNRGSEFYSLRFVQTGWLLLGSCLAGIVLRIKHSKRKS